MVSPILKETVECLRSLDKVTYETSPKAVADVYVAAIGLLALLKEDQAVLHRYRSKKDSPSSCPAPEEIPAISAVLRDAQLFGALINCLKPGNIQDSSSASTSASSSIVSSGGLQHSSATEGNIMSAPVGRKRALSVSDPPTTNTQNKSLKISHNSPVPSRKASTFLDLKSTATAHKRPSFKLPVLAATILSIAFGHVDHWPVQLVEVYTADCLGSRVWVDEKPCALLVKNLALVHKPTTIANNENAPAAEAAGLEFLSDAAKVAAAYRVFQSPAVGETRATAQTGVAARRPSISSLYSCQPMERAVSSETIDSTVRAQIPYENELDWAEEQDEPGEQQQEAAIVSKTPRNSPKKRKKKRTSKCDPNASSSSSGTEDEQVVATSESNDGDSESDKSKKRQKKSASAPKVANNGSSSFIFHTENTHYPLRQTTLNIELVRQRYFGENLTLANEAVHRALLERLDQKSRQNSGLLQALPSFTAVPAVRSVVAENLSRWLQSPALAGLARKLFAEMVDKMKNVDPPLDEDLRAIDFILGMKLKANQFSAHLENLTAVATRIPTSTVAQHIYLTLLRDYMTADSDSLQGGAGDQLKMLGGVHKALQTSNISYDAIAATFLTLLAGSQEESTLSSPVLVKAKSEQTVLKLRQVLRSLSFSLRGSFDSLRLLEALLSLDVENESWTVRNEEDKARLMFQCVTLHVSGAFAALSGTGKGTGDKQTREAIRKTLHEARKSLLSWCCTDYGPRWDASRRKKREKADDAIAGAGTPDYNSALGPMSGEESIPSWLNTMRCLLFIEEANSDLMTRFLAPARLTLDDTSSSAEEQERIKACCSFGFDIDNDMVRIVLKAHDQSKGSLPAEMAIQLLEHLFESCGRTKGTSLTVTDPELVWELYKLAQYVPPVQFMSGKKVEDSGGDEEALPRLAYPGFWWRATMMGLVMCGASPDKIGGVVWKEHPTLRALMKMVTSARYRFPTVDCDESAKEKMKLSEHNARETETKVAEFLFLPPKRKKETKNGKVPGNRVSRRLQKQQEEKEAAEALAESIQRKKMMKSVQKSIMLWDPDGPARKPPKECADLLLSIEKMFRLSESFQRCVTPDFLLMTIGQTTRGAIERAYDWLIPIISRLPDLISRLPSSTSCFLLLRAYGSDTGEKSRLKTLSAPLLFHVKESLRGKYGEDDCIRAFDLLMSDVASHNADRRKSARRVLRDSLSDLEEAVEGDASFAWMHNVLLVDHAKSLVKNAVKHMSKAATYERGKVLRSLILSLNEHLQFAQTHNIDNAVPFPALLTHLISQRPSVYAEAIDMFSDLRSLAVDVVHAEIKKLGNRSEDKADGLRAKIWLDLDGREVVAAVSLDLLQSSCVLLSILSVEPDKVDESPKTQGNENHAKDPDTVKELVRILLRASDESSGRSTLGLAGARYALSEKLAVTVESWIMLCKARDEVIGKMAAMAAPEVFLARLVMSSGLPRASLLAMVDRLGKLGENTEAEDEIYRKLMQPSTSSDWDLGRIGKPRDILRKLIGRLSAYIRLGAIDKSVSMTFLVWLLKESKLEEKPVKTKKKRGKGAEKSAVTLHGVPGVFGKIVGPLGPGESYSELEGELLSEVAFLDAVVPGETLPEPANNDSQIAESVKQFLSEHDPQGLDHFLLECLSFNGPKSTSGSVADVLFECVEALPEKRGWETDRVLKWVPTLSKFECTDMLQKKLFHKCNKQTLSEGLLTSTLRRCTLVWTPVNVSACLNWILALEENDLHKYSAQQLSLFLLFGLGNNCRASSKFGGLSEQQSKIACAIAFQGLEEVTPDDHDSHQRDDLPNPQKLLIQLSEPSKKHYLLVGGMILQRIGQTSDQYTQSLFRETFLRLYLLHPQWANTGAAQVRTVLLKAGEENEGYWFGWRSSMDDPFDDLLESLGAGDARVIKLLHEQSRKYPLLVLRKSRAFVSILKRDAIPTSTKKPSALGRVKGENIGGPSYAVMDGRKVRVIIRHWGYECSESVWLGVLEIYSTIPKEVLFFSGQKMGFWSILDCVLQLLLVQLHLTTANSMSKLKAKLSDIVSIYRGINAQGYYQWLSQVMRDGASTEVRNGLVSLSLLSPQEAIGSLKMVGNKGK